MTKQARSEHTRLLLLDAAAELLRREGYAATSMVDIAREAGVTKGGLYFHFTSKDEICDGVQEVAVAVLHTHVEREPTLQAPALDRLTDLGRALMGWLATEAAVGASFRMAREMGAKDARFIRFAQAWVAQVHQYVEAARGAGELGIDMPSDEVALLAAVTLVGLEAVAATSTITTGADLARKLTDLWRIVTLTSVGGIA